MGLTEDVPRMDAIRGVFGEWDRSDSPGCAVGVYLGGEVYFTGSFGSAHLEHRVPIKPSTVFHIASLSKQFTGIAVALLAQSGELSLDADVRRYIPELPDGQALSLRCLLNHTSGLRDQWDLLRLAGWRHHDLKTTEDIMDLTVRQTRGNFPPGERFQYINSGYTLLAITVERVASMSFRAFTQSAIFGPLGMSRTFFSDNCDEVVVDRAQAYRCGEDGTVVIDVPDYETVGPTGLFSTVEDFAAWERNQLHPVVGNPELMELMAGEVAAGAVANCYSFGMVWGTYRGLSTVEHAGGDGGYRAHYLRIPSEGLGIAVFSNHASMRPRDLARAVADVVLADRLTGANGGTVGVEGPAAPGPAAPGPAAPGPAEWGRQVGSSLVADMTTVTGTYRDDASGRGAEIELRDGVVWLVDDGGNAYEMSAAGGNRFDFLGVDAHCIFKAEPGGMATEMTSFYAGAQTAVSHRVERAELHDGSRMGELVGQYESSEVQATYTVLTSREGLWLRRPRYGSSQLVCVGMDQFVARRWSLHVRFCRNADGEVDGMVINAERVWHLAFTRKSGLS